MINLIIEITKYFMIFLFSFYTYECFAAFRSKISPQKRTRILDRQCILIFAIHFAGFLAIYVVTVDTSVIIFYLAQVVLLLVIQSGYHLFYEKASRQVTNNLCMLLSIGFIILTRLSFDRAVKQFMIAAASVILSFLIPFCVRKVGIVRRMYWFFAVVGILGLLLVAVAGATSYGAKISLSIAGISIQPSEFIKISFVFFVAGMLYEVTDFKRVCIASALAAAHVLILVCSRDLGGALIFFITYLVMLYVATQKVFYLAGGIFAGSAAAMIAYKIFSHVRVRVVAWKNPLSVIEKEGYQICQSLFAIGTGGWFGMGLYNGLPKKIPVVEQDFIFSAISEEMGGIFAICLIMVCVSSFIMFFNIAMQMKDQFYKLVALGLGTVYGFQVFLTIGGVTKFIPSTGVTLPLVSYGGSSLLSSMILFAIIQGMYILRQDEGEINDQGNRKSGEKQEKNRKKEKKKTGFDYDVERF